MLFEIRRHEIYLLRNIASIDLKIKDFHSLKFWDDLLFLFQKNCFLNHFFGKIKLSLNVIEIFVEKMENTRK